MHVRFTGGAATCELELTTKPDEQGLQVKVELGPVTHAVGTMGELLGKPLRVAKGYDAKIGEHIATIYAFEHEDLDRNVVELLSQRGRHVHVRWTATCRDFEHYRKRAQVTIDAELTLRVQHPKPRKRLAVLLVCPHEFQRDGERQLLKRTGYDVTAVGGAQQALRLVARHPFDVVYSLYLPSAQAKRLIGALPGLGSTAKRLVVCATAARREHGRLPIDALLATDGLESDKLLAALRRLLR